MNAKRKLLNQPSVFRGEDQDLDSGGKDLRSHYVPEEMFCWTKATDTFKPFKSQYEGYMGNYGNTMDRWYHRAAIVLWRKEDDVVSRFVIDPLATLEKATKSLRDDRAAGTAILKKLLPQWTRLKFNDSKMTPSLFEIGNLAADKDLAQHILSILDLRALQPQYVGSFRRLIENYGEPWGVELLRKWAKTESYEANEPYELPLIVQKLRQHERIVHWLLEHQLKELVASDKEDQKILSRVEIDEHQKEIIGRASNILEAAAAVADDETSAKTIDHILQHERVYPALTLGDLVKMLSKGPMSPVWRSLLSESEKRLEIEAMKKRSSDDFSILDPIACKCPDCKILSQFLKSTHEKQLVWPLAQTRRQHIHQTIDGMGIGVSHTTQRAGSPYKLILVKLDEHFRKEAAQREMAGEFLKRIRKLESRHA